MRYIRITRALNREENYVLNRDVCYYCTGTANISIRLRAVVSKRHAYPSDCEIQYIFREFFFFFLNETRNCSFRIEISLDPFCTLSDQLAFGYNSILLFRLRCGNWKKRQTKMNLHGSFRSCSTKYTESLWRAPIESHGYAKKVDTWNHTCPATNWRNHSLTDFDEEYSRDDFFSPKQNLMQIVSKLVFFLLDFNEKYFVKRIISNQKYARILPNFLTIGRDTRTRDMFCLVFFFFKSRDIENDFVLCRVHTCFRTV